MGIRDIFGTVNRGFDKVNNSLSDIFGQTVRVDNTPKVKRVDPKMIAPALRHLESSGGLDPNTPRGQRRTMNIPAANMNEQARKIDYDVGFGGEYGLTPVALAELAKSQINRQAPTTQYTRHGAPLTPGMSINDIQRQLTSVEGAGELAQMYFMSKRPSSDDFSPEALANDYINHYVGRGTPNDTPQNRKRVLDYFMSIAK